MEAQPAYRSVAVLGRGDRGAMGCEPNQKQLLAPRSRSSSPAGSVQQGTCLCSHSVPPQGGEGTCAGDAVGGQSPARGAVRKVAWQVVPAVLG